MNKNKMAPVIVKRRKKDKPKPTGLVKPKKLFPDMEFDPNTNKIPIANPGLVLMAYLAFKQPKKRKMQYYIPKDRAAWLDFQVNLVKKRAHIIYLTEKEIRKVILRSRASIGRKRLDPVVDKDLPPCFDWTQEQVAQWISDIGFPQFKEAFLLNNITGRRLIDCDASALSKMGLRYFNDIKAVAEKIRELLETHRPNMLRALMRKVPFELYLKQRRFNGRTYDLVDFQKFCEANDFPYEAVEHNKCAEIECICEVWFQQAGAMFERSSDSDEEGSVESIFHAPSVEFTVRHIIVRNQVVHEIIEKLIKITFTTSDKQTEAAEAARQMQAILSEGMEELGLDEEAYRERLEFAHGVAEEMVRECKRTAEVMRDIDQFKIYLDLGSEVTQDDVLELRNISEDFINEATALAVLLATGQLDLGNIFRQGPELQNFVDDIADTAEARTNALVKPTQRFLDEIICEAKLKILTHEFPELDLGSVLAVRKVACRFIDKMFCGECDPKDIDSCVVDVFPEDFIDTSFDSEIGAIFSTLEIAPKGKPHKSSSRPLLSKSNNFGYGPPKRPPTPPKLSPPPVNTAGKSEEEDYESAGALADDEQTGDDNPLSRLESAISAVADLKRVTRTGHGSSISGEGSGTTPHSSGEGSSDGQKKLSWDGSIAGEDGSSDQQQHVRHAHVIFDSTSSGTGTGTGTDTGGRRLRKKRGEHTMSKSHNPQSTSEDQSPTGVTAQDILDEIEALKIPDQPDKSDPDLNAKTPRHSHRKLSIHDSQALLKEKLRRAEFAQRWAEQADPMTGSVRSKKRLGTAGAERNARLVRMMADQIVSDAIQMALTHLLLQAESGQDSNRILAALKHIQIRDGNEPDTVDEDETWTPQLPPTVENSLPKLTGKDPRGTLPTGLWGWPDDKLPPAPDVRSHLRCPPPPQQQQTRGQGQGRTNDPHGHQTQHDDVCETSDAVCFYPIFQNWRVN